MERKEYLLATLNVYKYDNKKIKCDYSCVPVSFNEKENSWKSEVSSCTLSNKGFKHTRIFGKKIDTVRFSSEGNLKKVFLITIGNLENNEQEALKKLYYLFNSHFWYKFKYRKFLDKKKKLGQINF